MSIVSYLFYIKQLRSLVAIISYKVKLFLAIVGYCTTKVEVISLQHPKDEKEMKIKIVLTLLLITAVHFGSWAFETNSKPRLVTIQGVVVSAEDGSPISYATIYIDGTNLGTLTNDKGYYRMRLPHGEHKIVVTYIGFKEYSFLANNTTRSDEGKDITVDVKLIPSTTAIDDVVVEGKSQSRQLMEQGFALSSIDTQKAMLSTISTDELLNRAPGVTIRQSGGVGSDMKYSINGLSGSSVKVYIDGVSIENYGKNFTVSSIPPSLIERVDVFKGVVPAYLADDALGGAINVILKENSINMLNSSYSYGSYNSHRADVDGQIRAKKSGFTAGGSAYYNYSDNDYEVWGENVIYVTDMTTFQNTDVRAKRFHDNYEAYGVSANAGFSHVSWADKLRLDVRYSEINKDIQHGASMEVVYGQRRTEQSSVVTNLNYEKRDILPRLDIKVLSSYSYSNRLLIDTCTYIYGWHGDVYIYNGSPLEWTKGGGEGGAASLESNMENNVVGRVNLDYALDKSKKHKLSLNTMYTYFTRDVEDPYLSVLEQMLTETRIINKVTTSISYDARFFDEKLKSSIFYKSFMQAVTLVDPIVEDGVTIGQEYSNDILNGGYGAALSYAVTPKAFITFSAEKAVRLPSFTELLGDVSNSIEASIDLDPEESTNIIIGTLIDVVSFGGANRNKIEINANVFYRDVSNLIERSVVNQNDDLYGYENIGRVSSKGVDAEVNYNRRGVRSNLYVSANAGYADARFNLQYNEVGVAYDQYNNRLRNQPYLTSGGEVSYNIHRVFNGHGSLALSYYANYTHEFYVNWECYGSNNKAIVPTQFTHDIGVVYTFPSNKYFLSFDVKNIFDEQVFDNYALQKPGRWISAKFSYRLF